MNNTLALEPYLLPLRKFPETMVCYPREYVKITRPEDLAEFDYINSLNQNSDIDFCKFRAASSDLDWHGLNYILPIAQRKFLADKENECLQDFFEGLIWILDYDDGMRKLISLFSYQDVICFRNWFLFMVNDSYMARLFSYDKDDIMKHVEFLDNYIRSIENHVIIQQFE